MSRRTSVQVPFPSGRPLKERLDRSLSFLEQYSDLDLRCPLLDQPERWISDPQYLCGSDQDRISEIVGMWTGSSTEVVWCGRGGYGATRLLGFLERELEGKTVPRTRLLGYSDITALFAYIRSRRLPIDCVHAPVLTEIPDHPHPELILAALEGRPCPIPVSETAISSFHGPIWGGNLAVLASLAGTPWLPRITRGALFLEDIEEAPYRLDRFVTQLHDCGFFSDAQGVFLGQFTRCGTDGAGLAAVKRRLADLGISMLGELPVGHEALHIPLFFDLDYLFDPAVATLQPQGNRVDALTVRTASHGANDRG